MYVTSGVFSSIPFICLKAIMFTPVSCCCCLVTTAAAAKSLQSCLTLCDPTDSSPSGSAISGILQARTLEWVAISFSFVWKWKVKVKSLSCVWLVATPWTEAYQGPPSMVFSRQEYWSVLPLPSPLVPWLRIKPSPPALEMQSLNHWITRGVAEFLFLIWIVSPHWSMRKSSGQWGVM